MTATGYIHGTAQSEQERLSALNRSTNARFIELLRPWDASRILDLGCGMAQLAHEVARAAPGAQVTGVELSTEQLARAPQGAPNLQLHRGDVRALPFEAGRFDLVYMRYVLEHVPEPARVLLEARRVLAPGGRLVLQENDISLTRLDPPAPAFERVWAAFCVQQQRLGGDACIGSKLHRYLVEAGFCEVELSTDPEVHWYGSPGFHGWMTNLLHLLDGARTQLLQTGLCEAHVLDSAALELERLREDPRASALFHWNRATARSPRPTRSL